MIKAPPRAYIIDVYSLDTLMCQFKTHVWSHLEHHSGAVIMAKAADRERIDKMQRGFLYNLGCDDTDAFLTFNLAPPSIRRTIAMLGFVHKRVLGKCHPALIKALPFADYALPYHDKTLSAVLDECKHFPHMHNNSLWYFVILYNRLPQVLVDAVSVKVFQSKLTQLVRLRAQQGDIRWRESFQSCGDILQNCHAD